MSSLRKSEIFDVDIVPKETPSGVSLSPIHDCFALSSWDNHLYFYNYSSAPYLLKSCIPLSFPLLTLAFNDQIVASGCIKGNLYFTDAVSGQTNTVKMHESGIRQVKALDSSTYLTGSWDKTVKIFDSRSGTTIHNLPQPDRVYCLDTLNNTFALSTAGNRIRTYDIRMMKDTTHSTKLSWQIRSIALFEDGIAAGSIEGRAEFIHFTVKSKSLMFRCHRTSSDIYSVSVLLGHPKNGDLIITGGGDGNVAMYDKNLRQKVYGESMKGMVNCIGLSKQGDVMVVGTGYDWSRGYEVSDEGNQVRIVKIDSSVIKERSN